MTSPQAAPNPHAELAARALRVREHIVRMSGGGGCFIGASLSCADLLVYLYERVLRVSPQTLGDPNRDYLFLSKGHDVPALYGTLAELGYLETARLAKHLDPSDSLYWHPNRKIPGVEFHSGSLGHLLSVAIGVAMDIKLSGGSNRVFVVLGDGECDEGTIWEGALVAAAKGLDNLVAVIDRNEFQANIETERLIPLEPLPDKWRAFGWQARTCDGHSFAAMEDAFAGLSRERSSASPSEVLRGGEWGPSEGPHVQSPGKPTAIIAKTVRGKGLPSIEKRADRWFVKFTPKEVEMLLEELHGTAKAELTSETLVVR